MTSGALPNGQQPDSPNLDGQPTPLYKNEEIIYSYFLALVATTSPEIVTIEFKTLFIEFVNTDKNTDAWNVLFRIIYAEDEDKFHKILNRCCYILVNNWQSSRNNAAIQDLIQMFQDKTIGSYTASMSLHRLRTWLGNFSNSDDYKALELFASRSEDGPWSHRYSSYLLAHQSVFGKSKEQKEAAKALSRQLKERFKFDLAMYTARSQSQLVSAEVPNKNPTGLGNDVLRLIKTVVAKRGPYNYLNLANIFINQTQGVTYKSFKIALKKYLIFSVEHQTFVDTINNKLSHKLLELGKNHDSEILSPILLENTCKKTIDFLTTETGKEPSLLFILLLANGNPMTLAIVLLKLVLICKSCSPHLEACLANLIRYYEEQSQTECKWLINFLEVVRITFAIYADNVEYNVVRWDGDSTTGFADSENERYRIFSSVKRPIAETEEER
ncbi:hypothetical protein [Laspinema olomoucense]|uniref:Uncharacterized protein n=1 Tax=Laspinema olomoucense D3b TaxID=2953688 RepID=A0ABT2N6Z5_9CYAN|nr:MULTISPECIES: hypothetical protein [unclassified Laspinema]MCT7974063.1 hypothetical protein [Laspinema sp. D3d]MCT7978472.1 hypothetical protein [Laspinema sp. D3b]MCT7991107.1 hypothetical protein [Laspinema sp. D3a]MCT7997046.1 hypothetical protein [Laspinema sp. D3c]